MRSLNNWLCGCPSIVTQTSTRSGPQAVKRMMRSRWLGSSAAGFSGLDSGAAAASGFDSLSVIGAGCVLAVSAMASDGFGVSGAAARTVGAGIGGVAGATADLRSQPHRTTIEINPATVVRVARPELPAMGVEVSVARFDHALRRRVGDVPPVVVWLSQNRTDWLSFGKFDGPLS